MYNCHIFTFIYQIKTDKKPCGRDVICYLHCLLSTYILITITLRRAHLSCVSNSRKNSNFVYHYDGRLHKITRRYVYQRIQKVLVSFVHIRKFIFQSNKKSQQNIVAQYIYFKMLLKYPGIFPIRVILYLRNEFIIKTCIDY